MRKFESVIIIKPELVQEELKNVIENTEKTIKEVAEITNKEDLGLRKLAYEVKGKKEGYYVIHQFEIKKEIDTVKSIERYFRTQEEIIKFIIVERD